VISIEKEDEVRANDKQKEMKVPRKRNITRKMDDQ
jgi:hypothetical protein